MSEIIRTATEFGPVLIGATAGLGVGAVAESIIQPKIAAERKAFNENILGITGETSASRPNIFHRTKSGLGPLALTGAFVGAVNGYAWQEAERIEAPDAAIQFVIDRSGATAYSEDDSPLPVQSINKLLAQFDEKDGFKITAVVAESNDVTVTNLRNASNIQPFGDAPMQRAFNHAVNNINLHVDQQTVAGKESTPAIVVATHGNKIGKNSKTVVESAKKVNSPVYVLNVAEGIDNKTEKNLREISEKTDGQYWNVSESDLNQITDKINNEVREMPKQPNQNDKLPAKLLGLIGIGYFGFRIRTRRREPLTFSENDIKEGEL